MHIRLASQTEPAQDRQHPKLHQAASRLKSRQEALRN